MTTNLAAIEALHRIWPAWSEGDGESLFAVAFLTSFAEIIRLSSILDLGCGVGREAVGFGLRGHTVVGVEQSAALVGKANTRAEDYYVAENVRFVASPIQQFTTEQRFDLVLMWGGVVAWHDPEALSALLSHAVGFLKPGGYLVIEQPHRTYWEVRGQETLEVSGEHYGPGSTTLTRHCEHGTGRLITLVEHEVGGVAEKLPELVLNLHTDSALEDLLRKAGLSEVSVAGSHDNRWEYPPLAPPAPSSQYVAVRGRKL